MQDSEDRATIGSDIELLAWWFVRNHYENTNKQKNVPAALKYLIRNFSMKLFKSKFLSIKLDLDLIKLLSTQLTSKNVTLLYKPSEHGYSSLKFHEFCDEKGPTLTLIKSEFGNIFAGYTNMPWSNRNMMVNDSAKTFLFLLSSQTQQKCPKIWKSGRIVARHMKEYGPIFGFHEVRIEKDQCVIAPGGVWSAFDPKLESNDVNALSGADKSGRPYCPSFLVDYQVFKLY